MENNDLIAPEDVVNNEAVSQYQVDEMKDQLRVFLVAQARQHLTRVIKLTQTLDALEDKYQEKILQYVAEHDDESAVMYLPSMMDTIAKSLDRSYHIINSVVGNDKIMNFQITQNNFNNSSIEIGSSTSKFSGALDNPIARENVRNVIREILKDLPEQS